MFLENRDGLRFRDLTAPQSPETDFKAPRIISSPRGNLSPTPGTRKLREECLSLFDAGRAAQQTQEREKRGERERFL
jgi:hypothetical protein